jgi:hypothetical protein
VDDEHEGDPEQQGSFHPPHEVHAPSVHSNPAAQNPDPLLPQQGAPAVSQPTQLPETHISYASHALPQLPQFARLADRSTQP